MKYVLAILIPPLAILLEGKWFQAFINVFLCFLFLIPGIVHAWAVVASEQKKRDMNHLAGIIADQKLVSHGFETEKLGASSGPMFSKDSKTLKALFNK